MPCFLGVASDFLRKEDSFVFMAIRVTIIGAYSYISLVPITGTMFTRILTAKERKRVQNYLKADGEKEAPIRQLVTRAKEHLPRIEEDMAMLRQLLDHYHQPRKK